MADLELGPTFDSKKDEDALESPASLSESHSDEKKNDDVNPPEKQPRSDIVDWDGPDDPEFPQNLYVSYQPARAMWMLTNNQAHETASF